MSSLTVPGSVFIAFVSNEGEGSKYGCFECLCGGKSFFKITQSSGWCDKCGASYSYTGGSRIALGGSFDDFIIELEVTPLIEESLDDFIQREADEAIYKNHHNGLQ